MRAAYRPRTSIDGNAWIEYFEDDRSNLDRISTTHDVESLLGRKPRSLCDHIRKDFDSSNRQIGHRPS